MQPFNSPIGANMVRFPQPVVAAMHHAQTTVTCLPVQLDGDDWLAALFFVLPADHEPDCLTTLSTAGRRLPVGLEADLIEQQSATLITLAVEIGLAGRTLEGEVVFVTGYFDTHFESLQLLSHQRELPLFIGDALCNLLHQQSIPLADDHRQVFAELLKEAASRDALIRFRGQYDPDRAFAAYTAGR